MMMEGLRGPGPMSCVLASPKKRSVSGRRVMNTVTERRSRIKTGMRSVPKVAASQLHHDMARDGVVLECVHGQILAVT